MVLMYYFINVNKKLKCYKYYIMANISRNNASILMIISVLLIIFVLVTFFVISENNFHLPSQEENLEEEESSGNNNVNHSGYNNNRPQVFNLSSNEYSYDEARAACKAHGGDLATLEQMIEAHKRGANWCNYGWSENQMALYPTQVESYNKLQEDPKRAGECGTPGVNGGHFENPNLKFGANCYGVKPAPKNDELPKEFEDYSIDPLAVHISRYQDQLDSIEVSPFSDNKWSYYQPDPKSNN